MAVDVSGIVGIVMIFVLVLMIVALVLILRVLVLMEKSTFRAGSQGAQRLSKQS